MTVRQLLDNPTTFRVGQRYTYLDKETCIRVGEIAKSHGFEIEYGVSITGRPYFIIKDPFAKG